MWTYPHRGVALLGVLDLNLRQLWQDDRERSLGAQELVVALHILGSWLLQGSVPMTAACTTKKRNRNGSNMFHDQTHNIQIFHTDVMCLVQAPNYALCIWWLFLSYIIDSLYNWRAFVTLAYMFKYHSTRLTLNFLVAVVSTLNTKTHSSKEMAEFSFENADVKSILQTEDEQQTVTFFSECVETKLC